VQPGAARVLSALRARQTERLARLQSVEATLVRGNIDAGRRLFFGKSLCSTCHAVGREGGRFGPDLTGIGDIRSRHDILEAILFPSVSFAREYDTYRVRTTTATHTGVLKEQLTDAVVVEVAPDAAVRVRRADILAIEPSAVSMMPPGLEQMLTASELADLVAFLESLPDPVDRPSLQRQP
jgi:putative heme-binding domain-containing protein